MIAWFLLGEATTAITFLLIGLAVAFFYSCINHRLSTLSFSPSSFVTLPTGKPLLITRSTASRLKTSGNTRRVGAQQTPSSRLESLASVSTKSGEDQTLMRCHAWTCDARAHAF